MQTQTQVAQAANQAKPKFVGRGGGRPRGSKARIPPGHVNVVDLAQMLGFSPKSIDAMERRGDPRIPERSPLAGSGARRKKIWRIIDIEANTEALAARGQQADVPPVNAVWDWSAPAPVLPAPAAGNPRRPGRPRGTGKNRK